MTYETALKHLAAVMSLNIKAACDFAEDIAASYGHSFIDVMHEAVALCEAHRRLRKKADGSDS